METPIRYLDLPPKLATLKSPTGLLLTPFDLRRDTTASIHLYLTNFPGSLLWLHILSLWSCHSLSPLLLQFHLDSVFLLEFPPLSLSPPCRRLSTRYVVWLPLSFLLTEEDNPALLHPFRTIVPIGVQLLRLIYIHVSLLPYSEDHNLTFHTRFVARKMSRRVSSSA
jgi:hypothetical protein